MKGAFKIALVAVFLLSSVVSYAGGDKYVKHTVRIGTYNVQYPNVKGHPWPSRLPDLKAMVEIADFDVFGVQEPFPFQLDSMMTFMGERYAWIGSSCYVPARDDWHYNAIFYKVDRLKVLDEGVIWFADAPGEKWFKATTPRMCKWGKFKDKKTGKIFYQFNCHFDHKDKDAQMASAEKVTAEAKRIAGKYPYVISGDFNVTEDSPVYEKLASSEGLCDAMTAVDNPVNAEYFSWGQYRPLEKVEKNYKHFDHIFYTVDNSRVESWIQYVEHSDGSDHYPMLIEWRIKK